jgi:hypothetical protein
MSSTGEHQEDRKELVKIQKERLWEERRDWRLSVKFLQSRNNAV